MNRIIRLSIGMEIMPDELYEDWGGRTYYFIQDAHGYRYSERCTLPDTAWAMLENLLPLPPDEHGYTMDDEVEI